MSGIGEKVKSVIAEQLGVKPEEVTDQAKFVDDLGADSLDTVELVMALEEEYGIEIPDEDAEKLTTVGEAINYILVNTGYRLLPVQLRQKSLQDLLQQKISLANRKLGPITVEEALLVLTGNSYQLLQDPQHHYVSFILKPTIKKLYAN